MQFVADLHLHSKYSRAVSPQMTLSVMAEYASQKGIDLLTASDWTHPIWFKEIQSQLEEASGGMYRLKHQILNPKSQTNPKSQNQKVKRDTLFLLSTEISSIYKQGDKLRRIHNLVFVPSFETAERVNKELLRKGCNLSADGRPIVGLSSRNLLELVLSVDERAMLIPCHVWTPHFGIYGSASGFDSLDEAFGDMVKYIYGVETGLSSDPEMNWQVKELENRSILSFSDAHSPAKMGREATVFVPVLDKNGISNEQGVVSYEDIRMAIMRRKEGRLEIGYTLEFYPEEGKYHFSGHRNCKYMAGPEELSRDGNICPICKRTLTEGVFFRVQQLADRNFSGQFEIKENKQGLKWFTDKRKKQPPYVKMVPLLEIVAESLGSTPQSQKSRSLFGELCGKLGGELEVLLRADIGVIERAAGEKVAEGVLKVRRGEIVIKPGYDGEYGVVRIWDAPGGPSLRDKKSVREKVSRGQIGMDI
jgi:uncharacterized protein (TIGR00375 family)